MYITWLGRNGRLRIVRPASAGVRLPLRLLHGVQAATRFSHESGPPRYFGITWSMVNRSIAPQ